MYDRVNIKSVIIVTSLAAVISVAAGGIGGVPMGTLLIRALLFSLLFALGTALVNIIVDTFLPELKTGSAEERSSEGENEEIRGQNVDIVMDDGAEAAPVPFDNSEESGGEAPAGEEAAARDENPVPVGESLSPAAADPDRKNGVELPDIGVFSSLAEDEEEAVEEVDSDDVTSSSVPARSNARYSGMQTNDEEKIEYFQNNTSAEELAKGVRTMLKSDEKG